MSKQVERTLAEIEAAQASLRESIEEARRLAEQSQGLLLRHKQAIDEQALAAQRDVYLRENPI